MANKPLNLRTIIIRVFNDRVFRFAIVLLYFNLYFWVLHFYYILVLPAYFPMDACVDSGPRFLGFLVNVKFWPSNFRSLACQLFKYIFFCPVFPKN